MQSPIGVFDSGLGGLTFVKEIQKIMPNENIIYFGDTGRVPYGNKSREIVLKYAFQMVEFLKKKKAKIIIAACGTVSSILPPELKEKNIPLFGVVSSTCISAINSTKTKRIGVIATSGTIKSGSYEKKLKNLDKNVIVFQKACPLLVPLIENGYISAENETLNKVLEDYLTPLKNKNIDTLILGCTHYPIIKKSISKFIGSNVTLVDSGKETAKFAKKKIKDLNIENRINVKGNIEFFVSDSIENFSKTATDVLGYNISKIVKKVDLNCGGDKI